MKDPRDAAMAQYAAAQGRFDGWAAVPAVCDPLDFDPTVSEDGTA